MKKIACLMVFIAVACAGCSNDTSDDGDLMEKCDLSKETFDGSICKCDETKGYVGTAGACTLKGSSCDPDKEIADGDGCKCDESKGYIGTAGSCTLKGSSCDPEKEIADGEGCKCDESKGYVGTAGSCTLKGSSCDPNKEIAEGNGCKCDESKGYVGTAGSCTLKGASCDPEKEGLFNGECYKVGDELQFGNYPQTSADADPEPIDWIVLEASSDDLFILSKYGLDAKPYNKERENFTWAESTIRSWLNGYDASKNKDQQDYSKNAGDSFIRRAFNDDEIAMINEVIIDNPDAPEGWGGTEGGASTKDKIFFLTYDDAKSKYFKEDSERIVRVTPYAVANGVYKSSSNCIIDQSTDVQYCVAYWWLRSPGGTPDSAAFVRYDGSLSDDYVELDYVSSRPALHLNLNL